MPGTSNGFMESRPAAEGDLWSLVRRHEGALVVYAERLLRDRERARDVVQEAFLRLLQERDRASLDRPAAWLFRVCRNLALDVRRKEARMTPSENVIAEPVAGRTPDRTLQDKETSADVIRRLGQLPEREQEVIRLKFQGGLTYREISEVTGLSTTNVGFLIHKGLCTLRARCAGLSAKEVK